LGGRGNSDPTIKTGLDIAETIPKTPSGKIGTEKRIIWGK